MFWGSPRDAGGFEAVPLLLLGIVVYLYCSTIKLREITKNVIFSLVLRAAKVQHRLRNVQRIRANDTAFAAT